MKSINKLRRNLTNKDVRVFKLNSLKETETLVVTIKNLLSIVITIIISTWVCLSVELFDHPYVNTKSDEKITYPIF